MHTAPRASCEALSYTSASAMYDCSMPAHPQPPTAALFVPSPRRVAAQGDGPQRAQSYTFGGGGGRVSPGFNGPMGQQPWGPVALPEGGLGLPGSRYAEYMDAVVGVGPASGKGSCIRIRIRIRMACL